MVTSKAERVRAERAEAAEGLRDLIGRATRDRWGRPVVWVRCDHVARSGMSRSIVPMLVVDGEPMIVSGRAAVVLGWPTSRAGSGVRVDGCGVDMGFHLVYTLSHLLYEGHRPDWLAGDESAGYELAYRWLS